MIIPDISIMRLKLVVLMKLKTWKKWLIGLGITFAVLLVVGYFSMNYAVNYMLKSIVPSVSESILKEAEGTEASPKVSEPVTTVHPNPDNKSTDTKPSSTSTSKTAEPTIKPTTSTSSGAENANPAPTATSEAIKKDPLSYEAQVTGDKAKAVEESITLKEKTLISSVLLKKLSSSDIQLFAKMAGNGLSMDEKVAAKKIILEKLTEAEYDSLIGIAAKYGLSEGKKYKETSNK
ncbi:hypothetical protein D3C73_1082620 [compost metagenome]